MKKLILILAVLLSGCGTTKYVYQVPDFDVPAEPEYKKTADAKSDGEAGRIVGTNFDQCVAYSKQTKKIILDFKSQATTTSNK